MKFRIVEIKKEKFVPMFKPQYKNSGWFSVWENISDTGFVNSIHCKSIFDKTFDGCVNTLFEAETIIKDFRLYLHDKREYIKIHNIK